MSAVTAEYVERTSDGGWRVAGSRVSLDSVVHAYWDGMSPEAMVEEFPTLRAEQAYGAIAFYLRHKAEIDGHLLRQTAQWSEVQRTSSERHGPLLDRLRARRLGDTRSDQPS